SKEKIKKAVWDCGIDKSPGLDGFTFGFYHWYWNLLENDVVNAVSCFFHQELANKIRDESRSLAENFDVWDEDKDIGS
nr:RNA-directed DNA polymerase, eukaryota, reverse transcriptase zinc-binding domain protein [Tanacetum cinerariifolium]